MFAKQGKTLFILTFLFISILSSIFIVNKVAAEPPNTPENIFPIDGQDNVPVTTNLSWKGGDLDINDTVAYDVYFGTLNPPPKIIGNQSETFYPSGLLSYNTTYYWRIVAWDNHGESTRGQMWSFTTQAQTVYTLTLTTSGSGVGTIEANPGGPYYYGDSVTVWANASTGSTFGGFSGALVGTTTPQYLFIDGNKTVDALFTLNGPYTLSLTTSGTGSGTIQASPAGPYYYGVTVMIWANVSSGSTFTGFTGSLTGTITPQTIVMDGNKAVDAQFTLDGGFILTLTTSGAGSGTIQVSPSGPYSYGTSVTIWANASTGSTFAGFTGALTGTTTPRVLVMDGNKAVDAQFTLNGPYTLILTTSGNGSGTIQASPIGPYFYGASVSIWANVSNGSTFTGFTGNLSGTTTPQTLVMTDNKVVTANFMNVSGYTLTITIGGLGTVTKVPDLPSYVPDQVVQLTAYPQQSWSFSQWSGDLSGPTNPISITMTSNKAVIATFSYNGGGGGGGGEGGETPPPGPQNKNPVANASAGEPYQGFVNSTIIFDGSSSNDTDGTITTWFWVFGDNSNGTGRKVNHTFSKTGTYLVRLTVTDNEGATSNDTTTCVIKQPNRPPEKPTIIGPTSGTKHTMYNYTVLSSDPDGDSIQYTFNWGDSLSQPSGFLPNATRFTINHRWTAAGRYRVIVTVSDNQTESSSEIFVYIDALQTRGVGYLLDNNSDGIYDAFYSDESKQTVTTQKKDGIYLIDSDRDGAWDYTYDDIKGIQSYPVLQKTPGFEIIIALGAIATVVLLRQKLKKER